jgi:XTP/dITP diphosphohydrolase
VVATHNPGKLREMRELLMPYGIEAVSAGELGLAEPEETGTSFAENADIKARAAAAASGLPAFADDSGLAVDALDEHFEATVEGALVWPPRGDKGFGYDAMFLPDGHARTFGEMTGEEKHGLPPRGTGLSHRARAFRKLAEACLAKR